MAKATWNGNVIAEAPLKDCQEVEMNVYFPPGSVNREHLRESATQSTCPWKGTASYYDLVVDGQVNRDAAWYYAEPKEAAKQIANHVAFWRGVQVEQ